ncbi:TetR/AcrR family transcriptional regulator [Nocardia carnea]|uniref:TetR/AcrR family transcriptional regulator n=1 Tax=Nocardia carnea TaxID=37328 RepID=UPI00245617FF|nr:TetR/AcrR family transcriptional regulator C-terminal domain-containing protein [Nocardia carnea]
MPRDTLTRDQIVGTAIQLLDEEGLDGLNMRSLGKRLDAAPTAMYWHVQNKDNLVRLAADEVWAEITLPDPYTMDWRTAAETMAVDMYKMMSRHPWLVQAQASHLLYGENKSRHDDHALAVYDHAGFAPAEADRAVAAVFMFVLGNAVGAAANISLRRRFSAKGGDPDTKLTEALDSATEVARRFPRLRARIESAAGTGYNESPGNSFEFGLNALLDGLRGHTTAEETA